MYEKKERGVSRGHWSLDSSWEPGLVCPVLALTMWPGAESQLLMIFTFTGWCPSAGHFRVISLIQPRHTINNYLRTTGEQARQDTELPLVKYPEFLDSDWSGHRASW